LLSRLQNSRQRDLKVSRTLTADKEQLFAEGVQYLFTPV